MTDSDRDGFIKALARRVLGPAVGRFRLRRIAAWTKEHDSWEAATAFCDSVSAGGYSSELLTRYRVDKFRGAFLGKTLRDMESPDCGRLLLEAVTIFKSRHGRTPAIVDLGGAMGEGALYLAALLDEELDYTVVETEAVVAEARRERFDHATFIATGLELNADGAPGLLFSNGALPYAPDPFARLRDVLRSPYEMVVLGTIAFNANGRAVSHASSLAWNGPGEHPRGYRDVIIAYPRWNMDQRAIVALLDEEGYELERETNYVYYSDVDCYTKDLFFKAKARGAR